MIQHTYKHYACYSQRYQQALEYLERTLWQRNLYWISPRNISAIKKALQRGKSISFHYPQFPYDFHSLRRAIFLLAHAKGCDAFLLRAYAKKSHAFLQLLLSLQKKQPFPFSASRRVYGFPSTRAVAFAKRILHETKAQTNASSSSQEKQIPYAQAKTLLEEHLPAGWKLRLQAMPSIAKVSHHARTLFLKKQKTYSFSFLQRLLVHEIGVHVTRAENQKTLSYPYKAAFRGNAIEEGLAFFLEEQQGVLSLQQKRIYAGRLLAVYAHKKSLSQLIQLLQQYGFLWNDAFSIALRAKRGVQNSEEPYGLTKDHLYLSGYLAIRRWIEKGNNPQLLFQGIVHWKDLPLLQRWYQKIQSERE